MPLTARVRATRREVWVTGFDCGAAAVLLRELPHPARWSSPGLIERAWVLALCQQREREGLATMTQAQRNRTRAEAESRGDVLSPDPSRMKISTKE